MAIWWQHPPEQLRLRGISGAQWRTCGTCVAHSLGTLEVAERDAKVLAGDKVTALLLVTGEYELSVNSTPTHLTWPADIRPRSGGLLITIAVPLEEYVSGVLTGEAGGIRSVAALDALAIAARTYAVRFQRAHAHEGFDLCDTTHCQNLRLSGITERAREAAARTEGEILWYQGEPAATYYHRSCGGEIEDGSVLLRPAAPYLRAHPDEYCIRHGRDEWRGEVLKRDLGLALRREGIHAPADVRSVEVADRTLGGRAKSVRLTGETSITIPAPLFRLAVGREFGWDTIRSDAYDITDTGDHMVFFGRGQGHGVGLCQTGAAVMAAEGKSAHEILDYYFPGTQIGINPQGLHWTTLSDEKVQVETTDEARDAKLVEEASRALRYVEQRTMWTPRDRPLVRVYPTVAAFRDSTGEPGWVAASTRGHLVRLQPGSMLRAHGILEQTLRHEFAHLLIEERVSRKSPLWLREGLALYLAEPPASILARVQYTDAQLESILESPKSERQLRFAYHDAQARVAMLAKEHGEAVILNWLENGLPTGLSVFRRTAAIAR